MALREPFGMALAAAKSCDKEQRGDIARLSIGAAVSDLNTNTLIMCPLNGCEFSSGSLGGSISYEELYKIVKKSNRTFVSVHANFIAGARKKFHALQRHGFWIFLSDSPLRCKPFELLHPTELSQLFKITRASTT